MHPLGRLLAYIVQVEGQSAGCLIFGRPQCTRVLGWFGRLSDVQAGRCRFSQWEILNLARVYILPEYQLGGQLYRPDLLPGFTDRKGVWHSTLASSAIEMALDRVVVDYLLLWPPVYLDQPWELRQAISYCHETRYRCTLYLAASFELVRRSADGLLRTYARDLRALHPFERIGHPHRIEVGSARPASACGADVRGDDDTAPLPLSGQTRHYRAEAARGLISALRHG